MSPETLVRTGADQHGTALVAVINQLIADIRAIPNENPSFAPAVIAALRKTQFDSGHFVERCFQRLAQLPPEALPAALELLERWSKIDYRFSVVLARCFMQWQDYQTALRYLRLACGQNHCDLFAENTLIVCTRRAAAKAGTKCEFDGLEAYLANSFCDAPWRRFEVYHQGHVYVCCMGWLPLSIGNIHTDSLEDMWNSNIAQGIRKSILDGSFRYCSKTQCQYIAARALPQRGATSSNRRRPSAADPTEGLDASQFSTRVPHAPEIIRVGYDRSCNLACPQCRRDFFVAKSDAQSSLDRDFSPFLLSAAAKVDTFYINGSGEVFASKHCRRLLHQLTREQFPRLKFWLVSNGQLLNERAFREFDLYGRTREIQVSIDAARPDTYAVVRRGGDFKKVRSCLAFLDSLRRTGNEKFMFGISFVVSSMNFREMPEFVRLGRESRADAVYFGMIQNWGHHSQAEFARLDIGNPAHPDHQEFLSVLESEELSDPIVMCGTMGSYRRSRRGGDEKGFGCLQEEAKSV
jgi:MoaA/NifB/PqqE/SkfB family radical SAM enzyme